MTRARRTGRRAAWLCALGDPLRPRRRHAQTTTPTATTPPFEDRYIVDGKLSPDISSGDYSTSETTGLARSIRVDGVASVLNQEGPNAPPATHEDGFIMDAQWDTVPYGAWSADAAARPAVQRPRNRWQRNASFSLHQRALPFDGGWQADNAMGDINAPLINLASVQPRFILAQAPMDGVDTVWRGPSGLQLVAGAGEPGIYSGSRSRRSTDWGDRRVRSARSGRQRRNGRWAESSPPPAIPRSIISRRSTRRMAAALTNASRPPPAISRPPGRTVPRERSSMS